MEIQEPAPSPAAIASGDELTLPSAFTAQEGGDHYKNKGIQPIEFVLSNRMGFAEGSVIKYVTRWKDKGGLQDLRKARHFLDMLIEFHERPPPAA